MKLREIALSLSIVVLSAMGCSAPDQYVKDKPNQNMQYVKDKPDQTMHHVQLGEYECQFNTKTRVARLIKDDNISVEQDYLSRSDHYHWVQTPIESYIRCIDLRYWGLEKDKMKKECALMKKCVRLMWEKSLNEKPIK